MPVTPKSRAPRSLKPWLTFANVARRDSSRSRRALASPDRHMLAAEAWLCRAQDVSTDGGVSYGYTFPAGWRGSYPETSGYIASTFFRLARVRDSSYLERGRRIVRWLVSVQNPDGSFANPRYGPQGIVFDTGQVLFGLVSGYLATRDESVMAAARKAASWLTGIADDNGLWTRNEHLDTPHVYNTRTAWALLELNALEFDATRERIARCNMDWALAEQQPSGFFEHCAFEAGQPPFTHTIAYTTRGLLESGFLLNDRRYLEAAVRCADAMLSHLADDGHLPSTLSASGRVAARTCCLTGNCQFAIVWLRLDELMDRPSYRAAASRALAYVMSTQDLDTADDDIRGAIKGSQPVWGRYAPMSFPNWAAKFFVDAMWLRPQESR